jgi:ribonucleoside-diphosphate reductase alpha chain
MRAFASPPAAGSGASPAPLRAERTQLTGRPCPECHNPTLAKIDGCDRCASCGWIGTCG